MTSTCDHSYRTRETIPPKTVCHKCGASAEEVLQQLRDMKSGNGRKLWTNCCCGHCPMESRPWPEGTCAECGDPWPTARFCCGVGNVAYGCKKCGTTKCNTAHSAACQAVELALLKAV